MTEPVVSFIMSVYNGEEFLSDCIAGINEQTFPDYEVIVVNDGSTDGTPDILSSWGKVNDRVRVITRDNGGLTSALNLAISRARGKYLARHDADDISSQFRLERQVAFLDYHQNVVLASSYSVEFVDMQHVVILLCPPDDPKLIQGILRKGENPLGHGPVMIRREAFERLQEGYRFRYSQDFDLFLRLSSIGDIRIVPEVLYAWRNHQSRIGVKVRELRRPIHKLIMQVNGIVPMDSESRVIAERCKKDNKLPWKVLQECIIQAAPSPSEARLKTQHIMSMIGDNLEMGKRRAAIACAFNAIANYPIWWKAWLSLPYAIIGVTLPGSMVSRWRAKNSSLSHYRKPCRNVTLREVFAKPK
jgi:glycosyltransferase involved in cell wall biosynthesis